MPHHLLSAAVLGLRGNSCFLHHSKAAHQYSNTGSSSPTLVSPPLFDRRVDYTVPHRHPTYIFLTLSKISKGKEVRGKGERKEETNRGSHCRLLSHPLASPQGGGWSNGVPQKQLCLITVCGWEPHSHYFLLTGKWLPGLSFREREKSRRRGERAGGLCGGECI